MQQPNRTRTHANGQRLPVRGLRSEHKFCFVCLRLVYPMLPVSLDCPFLIAPSVISNVYLSTWRQLSSEIYKRGFWPTRSVQLSKHVIINRHVFLIITFQLLSICHLWAWWIALWI